MREETYRYWGLYSPKINRWLMHTDGTFFVFSAPSIAQSYLTTELEGRDFEVKEFGTEVKQEARALAAR